MSLPPRTPVLIGAGTATQRFDDPLAGTDAMGLMRTALEAAVVDAGATGTPLLDRVDEIVVPEGIWASADPGRLVLDGRSPDARSVLAAVGVLQQTAFTRAARAIADGDAEVVVVCGGEAKWRALRGQIAGVQAPPLIDAPGGAADVDLCPSADVLDHTEIHRGLASPTHQYAVMESALRHAAGRSPVDHARHVATLVADMSAVAAGNPAAWNRQAMTADEVLAAPLVAEPYTKPSCSQWNVDQAAAFLLTSVEFAQGLGLGDGGWIFPVAGAESNLMVPLIERAELHRSPAAGAVGGALAEALGHPIGDVELLEIYSCFPSAVQIQCAELGVEVDRPLTVCGGMHFAGGPLNSFTFQALARLVSLLREGPSDTAVVTSVSGMLTKVGGGAWSTRPPADGFTAADVTEAATAATGTRPLDPDAGGHATIVGYTVGHARGTPNEAVIVGDTAGGGRTVARSEDPAIVAAMREGEWCGRRVTVRAADLVSLDA